MLHVACRMLHVCVSHLACRMLHVACRVLHVACRMSHVACRMSRVACCMSHVACRRSPAPVACRMSQVDNPRLLWHDPKEWMIRVLAHLEQETELVQEIRIFHGVEEGAAEISREAAEQLPFMKSVSKNQG